MPDSTATQPRVALITGANRGIGRAIARELAVRRFHVVVGARDQNGGNDAVREIRQAGGTASYLPLDVGDSDGIREAARTFADISDRLHVLVNNAAIYPDDAITVLTLTRSRLRDTFETNTFGPLEIAQTFLPYLRRAQAARIINISSGYGQLGGLAPDAPSYSLSKLALNGMTLMLAAALEADTIAVNSMCPGWVRTDMGGPGATRPVEQGADTAVWLADDASQKLTGKFFRDRKEIAW